MLYIPKITNYLKILTDKKVNNFVDINFDECFKSTRETQYSKLSAEKILQKLLNRFTLF